MFTLRVLLLFTAFLCFVIGAFGVNVPKINVVALGLALWVATLLI